MRPLGQGPVGDLDGGRLQVGQRDDLQPPLAQGLALGRAAGSRHHDRRDRQAGGARGRRSQPGVVGQVGAARRHDEHARAAAHRAIQRGGAVVGLPGQQPRRGAHLDALGGVALQGAHEVEEVERGGGGDGQELGHEEAPKVPPVPYPRHEVRSVVDFYRRNPVVLAVVVVLGLVISIVAASSSDGGVVLPIVFLALVGIAVGLVIAWLRQRRGRA